MKQERDPTPYLLNQFAIKPARATNPLIIRMFELIDASGLTYTQIETKSGVSKVTMSNWRHNKGSPNLATMQYVLQSIGFEMEIIPCKQQSPSITDKPPSISSEPSAGNTPKD